MQAFADKQHQPLSTVKSPTTTRTAQTFRSATQSPEAPATVSPWLTVNAPGDRYEQQANRIADDAATLTFHMRDGETAPTVGMRADQNSRSEARAIIVSAPLPAVANDLLNSAGVPLEESLRRKTEAQFGRDFSGIRVHADEAAAEAARDLGANAFTISNHIVFGEGQFVPGTFKGARLLAHELTHSLQQSAAAVGTTGLLQRDVKTENEVARVSSPTVTARKEALENIENQLAKRMAKRRKEIGEMLNDLGPNPKSERTRKRAEALTKDLAKDLQAIVREPDSEYVNKALREDILESANTVSSQELKLKGAREQWNKYDAIFAGDEVAKSLGGNSITAAELKALVAQESGDLTQSDEEGDIAGLAQMGSAEEKAAGGKPGDRKIPSKAILLAAKLISQYTKQLDKDLSQKPAGADRKKFILASYNAGPNAIISAQREAVKLKKSPTSWRALVEGGKQSPLYMAIQAHYKRNKWDSKYDETTNYVERIFKRLP